MFLALSLSLEDHKRSRRLSQLPYRFEPNAVWQALAAGHQGSVGPVTLARSESQGEEEARTDFCATDAYETAGVSSVEPGVSSIFSSSQACSCFLSSFRSLTSPDISSLRSLTSLAMFAMPSRTCCRSTSDTKREEEDEREGSKNDDSLVCSSTENLNCARHAYHVLHT